MGHNVLVKDKDNKTNKINQITNIIVKNTYCSKCLSKLDLTDGDNIGYVKDHNGNVFCDDFCKSSYHSDVRMDMDANYREWSGLD